MDSGFATIGDVSKIIGFAVASCLIAFIWAPVLTYILYKFRITRRKEFDPTLTLENRKDKASTPVMGGLLPIITVGLITLFFNWSRSFTWVPIGVMALSATLGAIDDLLNMWGNKRRIRNINQVITLIKIHKDWYMRLWYIITLPWTAIKRLALFLGSHPGTGVYVHEKLILQFIAGSITAWWIYFKLGVSWHYLSIPFVGEIYLGWLIVPIIILVVMFTANAVNIADGMDGLAGGMLITTFGALTALSWVNGFTEIAILNATTVGALVTYTYFNIKPARFHMGDVGSLGLGALLAVNALAIGQFVSLIFIAGMFFVEAFSVIWQLFYKLFYGKRFFLMAPLHHHFEMLGWSEEKTVMRFWTIHMAMVLLGIWFGLHS